MLIDANTAEVNVLADRSFDACVVGAGPAGITLARTLAAKGRKVILLEAGGNDFSQDSQNVYVGETTGLDYFDLDVTRLRYFGGTSNHWGGWCRPLDEYDYEPTAHIPGSGWPISKQDLDPYGVETRNILDLPEIPDRTVDGMEFNPPGFEQINFWLGPPTRFAEKYGREIRESENITLVLNANVTEIRLGDDLGMVSECLFRNYHDPLPFTARARFYAICAGGLENPGMLLNSNRQVSEGLGNRNDLVGRYFCEHPTFTLGNYLGTSEAPDFGETTFLAPTREFMNRHEVGNFGLRIVPFQDSLGSRLIKGAACRSDLIAEIVEAVHKPFDEEWCFDGRVRISSEQIPRSSNRVSLSDERDRFDRQRISLNWQLGEIDIRTMQVAAMEFGRRLALTDMGRVHVSDWLLDENPRIPGTAEDEVAGHHHMCTTRMSDSPATGVVNRDLQIFGIDNLFVGGSSVFATAGYANPTYTIVQLSLKLADHIDDRLAR